MNFIRLLIKYYRHKKLFLLYLTSYKKFSLYTLKKLKYRRPRFYKIPKQYKINLKQNYKWYNLSLRTKITLTLRKKIFRIIFKRRRFKRLQKKLKMKKLRLKLKLKFINKFYRKKIKKTLKKLKTLNLNRNNINLNRNNINLNHRLFFYKKQFLTRNIRIVGSLLSNYNNFIMRTHDFNSLINSFEHRFTYNKPSIIYKNNLKKLVYRRISFKRKKKLKFWKLRYKRRRRLKRYKWRISKNALLFFLSSSLNFNLEKLLIFLLNRNSIEYSTKLRLTNIYKVKNIPNFNHLYLFLNNRNNLTKSVFSDELIIKSLKNTSTPNNFKKRTKKFFNSNFFFKKTILFKKTTSLSLKTNYKSKVTNRKCSMYKFYKKRKAYKMNKKRKAYKMNIFNLVRPTNKQLITSFTKSEIFLKTKHKKPFILRNIGLFITSKLNINNTRSSLNKFKFKFKKKYYSFLAPNQLKKSVLLIKARIIISRFFFKNKRKFNLSKYNKFSSKSFLLTFTSFFKKYNFNKKYTIPKYNLHSNDNIIYKKLYNHVGLEESDKYGEVFIPRIRFKPGYQRIWRLARTALKEALRLNYKYQYRLTRYLMQFSRKISSYYLYYSENTLERVVMYSKLLPDMNSFTFFLNNQSIYLNGRMVYNPKRIIYVNDIIQLIISQWFYSFYRWLFNWTTLRVRKFKRLVYRKGLAYKYKLMKTKKQKSRYTPNWIFNVRYDLIDVRPNLEVDYFTLSVFYLYEPYLNQQYPINELSEKRHHIYRLYNWKYIT